MRAVLLAVMLLALGLVGGQGVLLAQPVLERAPAAAPANERMPEGVRPTSYDVRLRIDPRQERFSGEVDISLSFEAPHRRMWLHGRDLAVKEIRLTLPDGRVLDASYREIRDTGWAQVEFAEAAPAGQARLHVVYDAPFGTPGAGLYRVVSDRRIYVASQHEAIDARRTLPCFDEPRFKTPFTFAITAPAQDRVFFNTRETASRPQEKGMMQHAFATTQPLPTYLLAAAVGPYQVVDGETLPATALRGPVPLRAIAPAGRGGDLSYALSHTRAFIEFYEDYFGVAYPFDKLDLLASPGSGGAMENAGLITYADLLLLIRPDASTRQRAAFLSVHAHELAHMWFGDHVTPAWWDDLWLNEAFATWMGNKAAGALFPEFGIERETQMDALRAMAIDSTSAARRIRQPIETQGDIEGSFDAITYFKGGGVLGMIESYLGAAGFRAGVRRHMQRFGNGVSTTEDFFASLAEGAQAGEVIEALRSFTDQSNAPLVTAELACPNGVPVARLAQTTYRPLGSSLPQRRWRIPVCLAAYGAEGESRVCAMLTEAAADIALPAQATCQSALMPNAGGQGYYRFVAPEADLRALIDRFDRITPAEQIAVVDSIGAAYRAGRADPARLLDVLVKAGAARDSDVVLAGVDLAWSLEVLIPADQRGPFARLLAGAFGPRLAALEQMSAPTPKEWLLRSRVNELMALLAHDSETRRRLYEASRSAIGQSRASPPDSDLRVAAFATLAQAGVRSEFEAALAHARASSDDLYRAQVAQGLAWTQDAGLRLALWEAVASEAFGGSGVYSAWGASLARPDTAEAAWAQFESYLPGVQDGVPPSVRGLLPQLASNLCSQAAAERVGAYFTRRAKAFPGHERNLAQALEQIGQCAALRSWDAGALARAAAAR